MEPTDEQLFAALMGALSSPPEHAIASARELHSWARLDVELAELLTDSLDPQAAGVRGGSLRELAFTSGLGTITVSHADGRASIAVDVANAERVEIQDAAGDIEVHTFGADDPVVDVGISAGRYRLLVSSAEPLVATEWFRLD